MRYLRFTRERATPGILGPGKRLYAVGDIHGHLDLFERVIAAIEADNDRRSPAKITIVVLGDFIDRGPQSAAMIRLLRACGELGRVVVLKGNHEATMVDAMRGAYDAMAAWIEFGGGTTLTSYGVEQECIQNGHPRELVEAARTKVPAADIDWLDALPTSHREDGYYFVHAGIRPGVSLRRQAGADQLWIRDIFTASEEAHGVVVVHGHSIDAGGVVFRANRIGVDTGAGGGGVLSAVALEGDQRWVIDSQVSIVAHMPEAQLR